LAHAQLELLLEAFFVITTPSLSLLGTDGFLLVIVSDFFNLGWLDIFDPGGLSFSGCNESNEN